MFNRGDVIELEVMFNSKVNIVYHYIYCKHVLHMHDKVSLKAYCK